MDSKEVLMATALIPIQINWVNLVQTLFSGVEALAIMVLLVLLVVGWARGTVVGLNKII